LTITQGSPARVLKDGGTAGSDWHTISSGTWWQLHIEAKSALAHHRFYSEG